MIDPDRVAVLLDLYSTTGVTAADLLRLKITQAEFKSFVDLVELDLSPSDSEAAAEAAAALRTVYRQAVDADVNFGRRRRGDAE